MKPITKKEARELARMRKEIPWLADQPVIERHSFLVGVTHRSHERIRRASELRGVSMRQVADEAIAAALDRAGASR